ncbi:MAG: DUF397 domain-containing protein [Actinophytocola sp.]|uniref:DUF397 domain-containing protein n=1 Tax=Actinophytocola sp. TaxID=1872138 RepID=UPI001329B21D|nr:DUF397 domain-containing protein [Actinophytocola sp.]MPZ84202.1 DUF397 domain-containing protein [Actinophytocola sp.]
MTRATFTQWRTSSYSTGNPNNCVEVGAAPHQRAVRDTKLGPSSPTLVFSSDNWETFTNTAKRDEFVLPR